MTTDNKQAQSVLTDDKIMALWAERADINHFARAIEQAVLSKIRGEARLLFPAHLRKMWSGGEVQAWIDEQLGTTAPKATAKGSLDRYRKWQAEQAKARDDGIEAAAAWVDKRRHDFDNENGYMEPDTGAWSFGRGKAAMAMEEYSAELAEISEGLRALKSAPAAETVPVDPLAVAQARILDELKQQEDADWQNLFWQVAKELKCLPSAFVNDNEHVIKAARAALAVQKPVEGDAKDAERWRELAAIIERNNADEIASCIELIEQHKGERASPTVAQLAATMDARKPANRVGTNSGHGHVWGRPDGLKAKCGGPEFCAECRRDRDAAIAQQGKEGE